MHCAVCGCKRMTYSLEVEVTVQENYLLFHRARAAFFAIADRFFGESFFALAFPPLRPPLRLAAVACVSDTCGGSGGASPVAMSMMRLARCIGSRGRFGRLSMARAYHRSREPSSPSDFKLRHYPKISMLALAHFRVYGRGQREDHPMLRWLVGLVLIGAMLGLGGASTQGAGPRPACAQPLSRPPETAVVTCCCAIDGGGTCCAQQDFCIGGFVPGCFCK
jgi:hypothetical protein